MVALDEELVWYSLFPPEMEWTEFLIISRSRTDNR